MIATAELAHYASLPPAEVERMLQEGELPVLTNLDRAEAERATHELNDLGATVDLRLTDASQRVYPVLKPDADRQIGVAVGGLIDDSATPPTVGEARGGLPQVEPDPEEPAAPRPRSRPRSSAPERGAGMNVTLGSGVHPMPGGSYRPAVTRGRRSDMPEISSYGDTPGFEDDPLMSPRLQDESPGEYGVHRGGEPPRAGRGEPSGRRRGSGERPGARAKPKPKPKPRARKPRSDELLGELGEASPSRRSDAPKLPKRLERAAAVTGPPQGSLEIDFEGAGVARPPSGGIGLGASSPSASGGPPMASYGSDPMARRAPVGAMAGVRAPARARPEESPSFLEMLRDDWIGAFLLSLGLGLVFSMVVALQFQRETVRGELPMLEEELALALSDPDGVEAGDRRAPEEIEDELSETLDALERTFYFIWLGTGFSAALSLTRLRRRWL